MQAAERLVVSPTNFFVKQNKPAVEQMIFNYAQDGD
jgi:hypothetical protein